MKDRVRMRTLFSTFKGALRAEGSKAPSVDDVDLEGDLGSTELKNLNVAVGLPGLEQNLVAPLGDIDGVRERLRFETHPRMSREATTLAARAAVQKVAGLELHAGLIAAHAHDSTRGWVAQLCDIKQRFMSAAHDEVVVIAGRR